MDEGENWRRLGTVTADGFTTNAVNGANIVKAFWGPALRGAGAWLHDFAGCDGVYVSADDGRTWTQANEGLHNLRLSCIAFDPFDSETLVAGTGGGGFVKGRWKAAKAPVR